MKKQPILKGVFTLVWCFSFCRGLLLKFLAFPCYSRCSAIGFCKVFRKVTLYLRIIVVLRTTGSRKAGQFLLRAEESRDKQPRCWHPLAKAGGWKSPSTFKVIPHLRNLTPQSTSSYLKVSKIPAERVLKFPC